MIVKIEVQARKKPKLNRFMDVFDLQMLLLLGFVVPYVIWFFSGVDYFKTCIFVILYIAWLIMFKIDKPPGYWNHWLSYHMRGKFWSARNGRTPEPTYLHLKALAPVKPQEEKKTTSQPKEDTQ